MTFLKISAVLLTYAFIAKATATPCVENTNPIPGAFQPSCEPDGTFSKVQCHGSGCYCAASNGTNLGHFVNFGSGTDVMNCNCARDKADHDLTGMIGPMFFCDSMGNYLSVQCRGSVCFCADANGDEIPGSENVPIGQTDSLNC